MQMNSVSHDTEPLTFEQPKQTPMLMALPAEIRHQILRKIIPQKQSLEIWVFLQRQYESGACYLPKYFIYYPWLPLKLIWGLLLVCKTLNQDAMYIFYGGNTFVFNLDSSAPRELQHAGGASFYQFSGLGQPMAVASVVASYIRRCEVIFPRKSSGVQIITKKEETKRYLQKWLSSFVEAFKSDTALQITIMAQQPPRTTWSQLWTGPLHEFYDKKGIGAVFTVEGGEGWRFKAVLSESRSVGA